jgi:hypothetical protein
MFFTSQDFIKVDDESKICHASSKELKDLILE